MDKCSNCYIIDRAKTAYCPDCKKVIKTSQDTSTVDVLDKIRNELINRYPKNYAGELELGGNACHFSLNEILEIINKYTAESE